MTERRHQAGRVQPVGTVATLTAVGEQAFRGFPSPAASSGLRGVWGLDGDGPGARLPTPLLLVLGDSAAAQKPRQLPAIWGRRNRGHCPEDTPGGL